MLIVQREICQRHDLQARSLSSTNVTLKMIFLTTNDQEIGLGRCLMSTNSFNNEFKQIPNIYSLGGF